MNKRIWAFDVIDEYELEEFTERTLNVVENSLGVKLPISYVELMRNQNGGRLFRNLVQLDQINIRADYILGIGDKFDEGILITHYMIKEWNLPDDIVLISGDGHSWFFLDYRQSKETPSVSYIDIEENIDVRLAINFEYFIDMLVRDSEEDEFELIAENSYTISQFEKIVEKGDDPFLITDGFLYFSVMDCDIDWLVSQAIISMDNPDEFVVPEVMAYMMKKAFRLEQNEKNNSALLSFAEKVKEHELSEVRRYYKKIINYIRG